MELDAEPDGGVIAAAARVRLEAVLRNAPVRAEPIQQDLRLDLATLVERKEPGVTFERAARSGQSVGGEEGAQHGGPRCKSRAESFRKHAVAHALRRAARLVEGETERVIELIRLELQQAS